MGNAIPSSLSCFGQVNYENNSNYDMTPVRSRNLPVVWVVGQPNTGKKTQGKLISEKYSFDHLNVTDLLRSEAKKDTERAKAIGECLKQGKKVNDNIVLNLLKENLLKSENQNGFVISNFPRTAKQADVFVKEINNVNFIFYLYCDVVTLLNRAQQRSDKELNETALRRDFICSTRDVKLSLAKFVSKIENVNASGPPEEVFVKIQQVFTKRLNLGTAMLEPVGTLEENKEPEQAKADVLGDHSAKDTTATSEEKDVGNDENSEKVNAEVTGDHVELKSTKEEEEQLDTYYS